MRDDPVSRREANENNELFGNEMRISRSVAGAHARRARCSGGRTTRPGAGLGSTAGRRGPPNRVAEVRAQATGGASRYDDGDDSDDESDDDGRDDALVAIMADEFWGPPVRHRVRVRVRVLRARVHVQVVRKQTPVLDEGDMGVRGLGRPHDDVHSRPEVGALEAAVDAESQGCESRVEMGGGHVAGEEDRRCDRGVVAVEDDVQAAAGRGDGVERRAGRGASTTTRSSI